MSKEINKLVQFISDPVILEQQQQKTQQNINKLLVEMKKDKLDCVNKEVLTVTKQLYPIRQYDQQIYPNNLHYQKQSGEDSKGINYSKTVRWVEQEIKFNNNTKSTNIKRWIPEYQKDKIQTYSYEKYFIQNNILKYTDEEYSHFIQQIDNGWTKEETDYLWDLCQMFDQRFIVIMDRYDDKYSRNIEDIKKRFYQVSNKIAQIRDLKNSVYYNYQYDDQYEKTRRFHLEKYLLRPKNQNQDEKFLLDELKKIDAIIKKEEKEQAYLRKALNIQEEEKQQIMDQNDENANKKLIEDLELLSICGLKIAYLRSSIVHLELPFSQKLNKQIKTAMTELNIPEKPLPTQQIQKAYDDLRQKILQLFKLQQIFIKIETEKKILDERSNKNIEDKCQQQSQLEGIGLMYQQLQQDELKRNINFMQLDPIKKKVHI